MPGLYSASSQAALDKNSCQVANINIPKNVKSVTFGEFTRLSDGIEPRVGFAVSRVVIKKKCARNVFLYSLN